MKLLGTQLAFFLSERETQRNIGALLKFIAFLLMTIIVFLGALSRHHAA